MRIAKSGRGQVVMRKSCRVTINDQVFSAFRGDALLDAALAGRIEIPYDCRAGRCGICRVRVLDGLAIGGECREPGVVRACKTRVMSDLRLKVEALPDVQTVTCRVSAVEQRASDVVEVRIENSATDRVSAGTASARAVPWVSGPLLQSDSVDEIGHGAGIAALSGAVLLARPGVRGHRQSHSRGPPGEGPGTVRLRIPASGLPKPACPGCERYRLCGRVVDCRCRAQGTSAPARGSGDRCTRARTLFTWSMRCVRWRVIPT